MSAEDFGLTKFTAGLTKAEERIFTHGINHRTYCDEITGDIQDSWMMNRKSHSTTISVVMERTYVLDVLDVLANIFDSVTATYEKVDDPRLPNPESYIGVNITVTRSTAEAKNKIENFEGAN